MRTPSQQRSNFTETGESAVLWCNGRCGGRVDTELCTAMCVGRWEEDYVENKFSPAGARSAYNIEGEKAAILSSFHSLKKSAASRPSNLRDSLRLQSLNIASATMPAPNLTGPQVPRSSPPPPLHASAPRAPGLARGVGGPGSASPTNVPPAADHYSARGGGGGLSRRTRGRRRLWRSTTCWALGGGRGCGRWPWRPSRASWGAG